MKGLLIHTSLVGQRDLKKIAARGLIGEDAKPRGYQVPKFKGKPIIFCSYFCEGYKDFFGDYSKRSGIIFETDFPAAYACPVDTAELMREGNFLLGHERFIFDSIESMLRKYPTSLDFKQDYQEYFRNLNPKKVYPNRDPNLAGQYHEFDYCLKRDWIPGYNEIAFEKPLLVKNVMIFALKEELEKAIAN